MARDKRQAGARPHVMRSLTLRNLTKNRMRTAVTVFGVALSCALLCAVLVSVNSFMTYLYDYEVANAGSWHASVETTDASAVASARENAQVADLTDITYVGQLQSWKPAEGDADASDSSASEASSSATSSAATASSSSTSDLDDSRNGASSTSSSSESTPVAAQLTVQAIASNYEPVCVLHLTQGRLPQNSHEIVLSSAYEGTTELTQESCELGSTVSGELALRQVQGQGGASPLPSTSIGSEGDETLEGSGVQVTYTVVGFYKPTSFYSDLLGYVAATDDNGTLTYRNAVETSDSSADQQDEQSSATYLTGESRAFTFADADLVTARSQAGEPDVHTVYVSTQGISSEAGLTSLLHEMFGQDVSIDLHKDLLRYSLITSDRAIWDTIWIIAGVICAVIVIASVSLIFNAFAISVAERTRQFGLLSSIGASRRQIRSMVFWEAGAVAGVGIPCGLLLGVAGSSIVLSALSGRIEQMLLGSDLGVSFHASVDPFCLVVSALLGAVIVILSAWVPAGRAASVSAVDALRNVSDQRLSARQRRRAQRHAMQPWAEKGIGGRLLGMPATLATKCSSRGRAKARVATASLAVAVMLFVSAGALDMAITRISGATSTSTADYDLGVAVYSGAEKGFDVDTAKLLYTQLSSIDGVTGQGFTYQDYIAASMPTDMAGADVYGYADDQGAYQFQLGVCLLDDDEFNAVAAAQGISSDQFYDSKTVRGIGYNGGYSRSNGKYATVDFFKQPGTVTLLSYDEQARSLGTFYCENVADDGTFALMLAGPTEDGAASQYARSEHASAFNDVEVVSVLASGQAPEGVNLPSNACLLVPVSNASALLAGKDISEVECSAMSMCMSCYFNAAKPADAYESALELLRKEVPGLSYGVSNGAESRQSMVNLVVVFNTFSYAFAAILALVAVANVFNTIVSGLLLRRREFAVLQSLGMTRAGISRMVAWECVRFGIRGLIFGLIASVVVSQLLFYALTRSFDGIGFAMPWASVGIAIAGTTLVTILASAYGLKHAKADNVVEALRMQ